MYGSEYLITYKVLVNGMVKSSLTDSNALPSHKPN